MLFTTSQVLAGLAALTAAHVAQKPLTETVSSKLTINSTVKMNSGHYIPLLGFGVWQTPYDQAEKVVETAVKVGYRHVDSAIAYRNEKPSAAGLLDSKVPRSELFFTSKIPPSRFGYESAKEAVAETLEKIGDLRYIDLYLMHAPGKDKEARLSTWKALVEAVEAGQIKSIGVSNYEVEHLEELEAWQKETEEKEGKGKGGALSVNQMELHPWTRYRDVVEWCTEKGVVLEAYSPLTRGDHLGDAVLAPIAKRTGKTPAQVLIRWSLQKGFVPLPKSVTPSRIQENTEVYDFEITEAEMKTLEELDADMDFKMDL